jgi:hypothetical protein
MVRVVRHIWARPGFSCAVLRRLRRYRTQLLQHQKVYTGVPAFLIDRSKPGLDGGGLLHASDRLAAYVLNAGKQKDFVGSYYSEELDTSYRIEDQKGSLFLARKKYPSDKLLPFAPDLFASSLGNLGPFQSVLQFTRGSNGQVTGLWVSTERVRSLKFVRQESQR